MQLLCRRLHVQTLGPHPKVLLRIVLPAQRRQRVRRVVVLLAPRPNVHLLPKVLDQLLNRVMMVVATAARRSDPTAPIARPTALLGRRRRRWRITTVLAQALNKARIVKSAPAVLVSVHTGRVLVHRMGTVLLEEGTPIAVRQQRRQFVLLIRPRVRKILVVRLVLVDVVEVMWKVLVRRRRGIVVVK